MSPIGDLAYVPWWLDATSLHGLQAGTHHQGRRDSSTSGAYILVVLYAGRVPRDLGDVVESREPSVGAESSQSRVTAGHALHRNNERGTIGDEVDSGVLSTVSRKEGGTVWSRRKELRAARSNASWAARGPGLSQPERRARKDHITFNRPAFFLSNLYTSLHVSPSRLFSPGLVLWLSLVPGPSSSLQAEVVS